MFPLFYSACVLFSIVIVTFIVAPLAGYLADKYSLQTTRIIIMCCAVVTMLGFSLTALAPNIWVALVTYGVVAGMLYTLK